MGKIAFLFAGQGAQHPGMGLSLYENSPAAKAVFDLAEEHRPGTRSQCFSGSAKELVRTSNTQPCVYCVDLAAARALQEAGVHIQGAAGFSLGELAALTFCGAFPSDAAGFSLVTERGRLMERANFVYPGKMAAVLKLPNEKVETLCEECPQKVYPVNYNCPGQLVVAGVEEAMEPFCESVKKAGGRAKVLAVGGGFHSPLMHSAAEKFAPLLKQIRMQHPRIPVYANVTAEPYQQPYDQLLVRQMESPVRWEQTIRKMATDGFDTFVEVGPGKTLSRLVRRILSDVTILQVEEWQDVQTAAQTLLADAATQN